MAQVITTILLDDNPKGVRLTEIDNWSGKAFVVPRGKLKELRSRDDIDEPGIYFLFGEGKSRGKVYIGQSERALGRLVSHDAKREEDEWNTALVFTGGLDSTYIKYLESISIEDAKRADRYDVFNSANPNPNRLSEAQKITVQTYLENLKLLVGFLGFTLFDDVEEEASDELYFFKTDNALAKGRLLDSQEFIVYKDSTARVRQTNSFTSSGKALRAKLIAEKVLKQVSDVSYEFTRDYIFTSPSAASGVVAGRATNGWKGWKDEKGKTLNENIRS